MKFKQLTKEDKELIHNSEDVPYLIEKFQTSKSAIYSWKERIRTVIEFNKITNKTNINDDVNNTEDKEDKEDKDILSLRKQVTNHKSEIAKLRLELKDALKEATTTSAIRKLIHGVNKDFNILPEWISPNNIEEESKSKNIAYMMFSDIHYSEVVNPDEVNGVNQYNKQIAKDRLLYTIDKFISIMHKDFNLEYDACVI